jgi:hypothetical protein
MGDSPDEKVPRGVFPRGIKPEVKAVNENTYVENPTRPGEGINKKGQRVAAPSSEGGEAPSVSSDLIEGPEAPPAPEVVGVVGDVPEETGPENTALGGDFGEVPAVAGDPTDDEPTEDEIAE